MNAAKKPRRQLHRISDEIKVWSARLVAELKQCPDVTARHFFGSTAMYRTGVIFGALPKTRGMNSPNSLAFKMVDVSAKMQARLEEDTRIQETHMHHSRWFSFEVASDEDLRGALEWLGVAYEAAGKKA